MKTGNMRIWLIAALSIAGIVISGFLAQHYYEIVGGYAGFSSFCNISEKMNCDLVAASRFAQILPGFPLASFGAGWFLALFATVLFARNPFWHREALRAALLLTVSGTVISLTYLFIMITVVGTYCILCLALDGIQLVCLALVLSLKPEGFSKQKPDKAKWKTFGWVGLASLLIAVVGLKMFDQSPDLQASDESMVNTVVNSPVVSVRSGSEYPSLGEKDAPVTIVEFSDFQCPYCRLGAQSLNSLLYRHRGKIRIVFRNFPLDATCNRLIDHPMHAHSCEAARTAMCAFQQGKFEKVYSSYFENQSSFTSGGPDIAFKLASDAGADSNQLKSCVNGDAAKLLVSKDIEEGIQLGIQSTPTFFINGHKLEGLVSPKTWDIIIKKLGG